VQGRNPTTTIQVLIMDLLQQQLLTMVHMISATTLEEEEEEEEDQGLIQLELDLVQQTCSNHQTKSLISSNSRHTMGLLKVGQGQRLDNNNSMGGLISLQEEVTETKLGRSSWAMVQAEEEEEEEEEVVVAAAAMALIWVVLKINMQQQQLIPTVELQIKEQDIMESNKALKLDMELP
jgi:hypothetical protein